MSTIAQDRNLERLRLPEPEPAFPGGTALQDGIRSALARARAVGDTSAVLVVCLRDAPSGDAGASLVAGVRTTDVVADLGDGSFAVVLFGVGRLSAAAAAERLERRLDDVVDIPEGCSSVGMTFVAPWERRTAPGLLSAARTDLRERRAAPQCAPQADLAHAA